MCKTLRLNSALCIPSSEKKPHSGLNAKVKLELRAVLRRDFFLEVWPKFESVDNFKREAFGSDKSGEVQVLLFDKIK